MKSIKIMILVALFFVFSNRSSAQEYPIDSANLQILRIAPETAIGGDASLFINKVNYIPLETSKKSEFGTISQLEITSAYFIILDQATNAVLIFKKDGKFHAKIKIKGGANKDNYGDEIKEISINQAKEQILVRTRIENNIFIYDFNGKFLEVKKTDLIKGEYRFLPPHTIVFNGIFYDDTDDLKKFDQFWLDDSDLTKLKGKSMTNSSLKKLDSRDIIFNTRSLFASEESSECYRTNPYDYNVYTIGLNKIKLDYRFLFPLHNSIPSNFVQDTTLNRKRRKYLQKNPEKIYSIANFYKVGNNIIFKLMRDKMTGFDDLIYNLQSQTLIAFEKITPDIVSSYLTIAQPSILGVEFANNGILQIDNGYLYTSYSSLEMFKTQKFEHPPVSYDAKLKNFFANSNDHSNPVIVEIQLKSEL